MMQSCKIFVHEHADWNYSRPLHGPYNIEWWLSSTLSNYSSRTYNITEAAIEYVDIEPQKKISLGGSIHPLFQSSFCRDCRIGVVQNARRIVEWATSPNDIVAPFVIDGRPPDRITSVPTRLLLFNVHVPKIYVSDLRMSIWKQLIRMDRSEITVQSHSANWALSYENCSHNRGCHAYRKFDFNSYRKALNEQFTRLSPAGYKNQLYDHRFVLLASGDFPSQVKITESIVHFANGGAVPVFVVPPNAHTAYPYSHTVKYCNLGVLVTERLARKNMSHVLEHLKYISHDRIRKMRKYAKRVSPMFTYDTHPPNAAHYVLSELCESIRSDRDKPLSLAPCMLTGKT